jgi:tetratricopeptide (TPR) repeat protein
LADNQTLALQETRRARTLRPDWDRAVLFEAKILLHDQPTQALNLLKNHLDRYPTQREVKLFYARALLEQKDYSAARAQFRQLLAANPESSEMAFAIALLSLQLGELDLAEKELQETLALGQKDTDTVHYYLGQLSEEKKDDAAALSHYRLVQDGEHLFASRLREAYLLNQMGKLNEAREILKSAPAASNQQRVTAILIEAQMLRDANNNSEYYQVVSDALDKLPNHPQLLYELAMAAEKLGKTDIFEKTLRKLIQLSPDHAHAYNALGYSFLERNERIEEAVQLVEKAHQLAPDDPSITDSVGWGYYRAGKLEQSIEFLTRAFKANPDPEIAAHLGEVLWVKGQTADAQKVWETALKAHPDNKLLQATIKKFIP